MKPTYLSLLLAGALAVSTQNSQAQTDQNRTIPTKIADLLAKVPAADSADLINNALAVADLGETGLAELIKQLEGSGDKSRQHFALSGFSFYATQTGREAWRSMATNAYGKALSQVSDPVVKQFLLAQLQQVGKNDAIPYVQPLLTNDRLSDAASRVLTTINTKESLSSLHEALKTAEGNSKLYLVQSLGHANYQPATTEILEIAKSANGPLKNAAYYALASIGSPAAESMLAAAAKQAGYRYENSEATAAYLELLGKQTGNKAATIKKASSLMNSLAKPEQAATRIALLKLISNLQGEAALPLLQSALKDKNAAFRQSALQFAAPYITSTSAPAWIKAAGSLPPTAKAELVNLLAAKKIEAAAPMALQLLDSKDPAIRTAVMNAAVQLAGAKALPVLSEQLKGANEQEAMTIQKALLLADANAATEIAAGALANSGTAGKVASINVLGERAAASQVPMVLPYLSSSDKQLKEAAAQALSKMVIPDQLESLFPLLANGPTEADLKNRQDIVISALKAIKNPTLQTNQLLNVYRSLPANKQSNYYRVMASLGGSAFEQEVLGGFKTASADSRIKMAEALGGWKEGEALSSVFRLANAEQSPELTKSLIAAFIQQLRTSKQAPENKYLMIRDLLPKADKRQQATLISQLGSISTYPSLLYTASFMDDPALKNAAANAVMNACLNNDQLKGAQVHQLLEKAIATVSGNESDYLKAAVRKHLASLPKEGDFVPLFNGRDLSGWKGLVGNPISRAGMDAATLAREQEKANAKMLEGWSVKDGLLVFNGHGDNLCTDKKYRDFELFVDWKITKDGDAGIYLRGTPQVQIWDTSRHDVGAQVGSGGLYNNQKNPSKPTQVADNAIGEWNQFRILMEGDMVTVYLNGKLVTDKVPLENYWDRKLPLFREEQIELQAHGTYVAYRDVLIREIKTPEPFELSEAEKTDGFKVLFDGTSLHEWVGNKSAYIIEDGNIAVYPKRGGKGNLFTKDEYSDFVFRFEFKLTPGANNGVGVRAPLEGDAAYQGMEIQILDNDADIYKNLQVYQYHGSVYGVLAAKRGYLKPVGEWNQQEIELIGNKIKVTLNGTVITEGDLAEVTANGTVDKRDHPGLKRTSGHIGFLGHGDTLFFRNIRVKDLSAKEEPVKPSKKKTRKKKRN
jgi:HEAT repeat protein